MTALFGGSYFTNAYLAQPVYIVGSSSGQNRLVAFLLAVLIGGVLWLRLRYTRVGLRLRALAVNPNSARLMGIDTRAVDIGRSRRGVGEQFFLGHGRNHVDHPAGCGPRPLAVEKDLIGRLDLHPTAQHHPYPCPPLPWRKARPKAPSFQSLARHIPVMKIGKNGVIPRRRKLRRSFRPKREFFRLMCEVFFVMVFEGGVVSILSNAKNKVTKPR